MSRNTTLILMAIFLLTIEIVGCLENNSSILTVEIESYYSYDALGPIYINGVEQGWVYATSFKTRTYNFSKDELPDSDGKYTVMITLISGGVNQSAVAYNVTTYVKFRVYGIPRETEFGHTEDHYVEVIEVR